MSVVRWTFYDQDSNETYTFPVNPREGGTPPLKKTLSYVNTAAPDGRVLAFQGRPEPGILEFSGTIMDRQHLDIFTYWWRKNNQILLTDDLGRKHYVIFTEFEPKRVRAYGKPYKHTYTMRAVILNWPASTG